jgi:DNA polymerase elongation subunit (family B)
MCEIPSVDAGLQKLDSINDEMSPIIVQFEKWSETFVLMGKNRYCGLVTWTDGEHHDPKRYVKGIELKQSRMPTIMKESMGKVIDGILNKGDSVKITDELSGLVDDIVSGKIDPLDLCMKGKLNNDLENYKSVSGAASGAQWANRTLGKGYRKGDYFLCVIDPKGNYMAFDHPSEIEGIAEIGYRTMVERFIIGKVKPYYEVANWDMTPLFIAMNGKRNTAWV